MDFESINLNIEWIDKEIKMFNENGKLSKEHMKSIFITHVFINSSSEIVKTYKTEHTFNENAILSFTDIYQHYKKNRIQDHIKYNFNQFFIYNIDLDDKLYSDIKSMTSHNFLEVNSYIKDVTIQPSLFIFHEINCAYIIYKEQKKGGNNKTAKICKTTTR